MRSEGDPKEIGNRTEHVCALVILLSQGQCRIAQSLRLLREATDPNLSSRPRGTKGSPSLPPVDLLRIVDKDPNRYILVQHNCVYGKFTTPKSKKSRRVDLSRELRRVLLELRDKRMLEAFMSGKTSIADELIFPSKAGTVLDPSNLFHYHFLPCLELAGLRRFRFHDLRHTFGSLLIQDGASLANVKDQMGHSSIQITVDTYGHLIPGANINWVDGLDRKTSATKCNSRATGGGGNR